MAIAPLIALVLLSAPPHSSADDPPSPPPIVAESFEQGLGKGATHREVAARFIAATRSADLEYGKALDALAARLRAEGGGETPAERAARLRTVLFGEGGFAASAELAELENLFPDKIVARRRGYCLGLTLVLLDLCDRLGWAATAVSAPRHTFLRLTGEEPANVETTLAGATHDDDWYRSRFAVGDLPAPLRALSPRQLAGHLLSNTAYSLLESGDPAAARALIERALRLDPGIVEARTNLGVCDAREERYEAALASFDKTLEEWPGDPPTRLNRVNALLPLGRRAEAIGELVDLLDRHPTLRSLSVRAAEIRDRFEVHRDWADRQRLTIALARAEERRRGAQPGLAAVYFRDERLGAEALRRIDDDLSFQWGWNGPGGAVPVDRFSARWRGWLAIPAEDTYTFFITCSDGVRVSIDGRMVVDAWTRANNNFPTGSIDLLPGRHELVVEYFESSGEAGLKVILTSEKEERPLDLPALLAHPRPEPEEPPR